MNAVRCSVSACWCYFRHSWRVLSSDFRIVLVHTLNSNWVWGSNVLLVWRKGNRTIWFNDVGPNIWNFLSTCAILEGHWLGIIKWHQWITLGECWLALLWLALNTIRCGISTCWRYLGHSWGVLSGDFSTVLVHAFNSDWCWGPNVLLIWGKGNRTIWVNGVDPDTWHRLSWLAIFKGHWAIQIDWHGWVTWSEDWRRCLWLTLDTCRSRWCASWCYLSHGWSILSRYFRTVLVYAFYNYRIWRPNILLIWRKGNRAI